MTTRFKPKEANEQYEQLSHYSETRMKEISGMMEPYIKITDRYGRLISRIVLLIGKAKPKDIQDVVIRDLLADVFDFLYESRPLILSGKLSIAFPLARRAYESLSLLNLCAVDKSWAEKWQSGKKISNGQIRKELAKHPFGESEENTRELYDFFCSATHPNRKLIPQRFLGEGNEYVLGVIGKPELLLVVDYCIRVLNMWFWLTAMVSYLYRETIIQFDKTYMDAYGQTANEAQKVNKWLTDNFNHLLKESQDYWATYPVPEDIQ
jgi:hypothetical protein